MSQKLAGYITVYTNAQDNDTQLHLSSIQLEQKKSTEWTKVEVESMNKIAEMFGKSSSVKYANDKQMHCTAMFHILSDKLFRNENDNSYFVFQLGSIHNMHGIVSTMKELPVATSDGTSEFQLSVERLKPLNVHEFYQKVVKNNASRSSFMLAPRYYFNPQLNLLRKLPGKTIDFVSGSLEDEGIDVTDGMEFEDDDGTDEDDYDSDDQVSDKDDDDEDGAESDSVENISPKSGNSSNTTTTLTTTTTTLTTALSASTSSESVPKKRLRKGALTNSTASTEKEKVVLETLGTGW